MRTTLTAAVAMLLCAGVMIVTLTGSAAAQTETAPNTLTPAEQAAGWRLLFDGATTAGWRSFKQTAMPAGWTVEAGALSRTAKAADIVSVDQFGNFELAFEWKIAPAGNSGVFYRATEDSTAPWHSAPEFQILDNAGHADGKVAETSAASAYALYAPAKEVTRKPGEWNQARIVVNGTQVEHWLNGVKVVAFDMASADWNARVAKSKFAKYPQFGKAARGHIGLQDHGDAVSYRSIKIRNL